MFTRLADKCGKQEWLFPDYERDARLVPTHTRAGLDECYSDWGAEEV